MKYKKISVNPDIVVQVANDAMIMNRDECDGKMLPVVILDTENHPNVDEFIKIHRTCAEGEVKYAWGMTEDKKYINLYINSISPIETSFIIEFEASNKYALVDRIVETNLLILQSGKKGDRITFTWDKDRILLEIPDTGFEEYWSDLKKEIQRKHFLSKGIKKKDVNKVIELMDDEWNSVIKRHFK